MGGEVRLTRDSGVRCEMAEPTRLYSPSEAETRRNGLARLQHMGMAVKELPDRLVITAFPSGYRKVYECALLLHTGNGGHVGVYPPESRVLAAMLRNRKFVPGDILL